MNQTNPFDDVRHIAKQTVATLAKRFGVSEGDISILLCSEDGQVLRFLVPDALFRTESTLHVNNRSVAGQCVMYGKPYIHNEMQKVQHMALFERAKTDENKAPKPVQKMLTYPLKSNGKVVGVVQCCRKGDTPQAAGPDFLPQDTVDLGLALGPSGDALALARPAGF